jgi:ADP-heptose:LPS heptosyltransferase
MIGTLALGIGPIVVVLSVIIILMLVFLYFKQQRVYKKIKHIAFFTANPNSTYANLNRYGAKYIKTNNLNEFIDSLSKYQHVITAEGGSAHIAGALGLSVYVISGTKNQSYWKPHTKNIKTFVNTNSVAKIKPESIVRSISA